VRVMVRRRARARVVKRGVSVYTAVTEIVLKGVNMNMYMHSCAYISVCVCQFKCFCVCVCVCVCVTVVPSHDVQHGGFPH
jgi:hypothetical protein